jgi:hypothetical protein
MRLVSGLPLPAIALGLGGTSEWAWRTMRWATGIRMPSSIVAGQERAITAAHGGSLGELITRSDKKNRCPRNHATELPYQGRGRLPPI